MSERNDGATAPSAETASLEAYLPGLRLRRLARHGLPRAARAEPVDAAALFVDLSGFSELSERFARRGPRGAEELASVLDRFFGGLAEQVRLAGGDVLAYAGDALLALWETTPDVPLGLAARLAGACALSIQSRLSQLGVDEARVPLRLRASVGAGSLQLYELGGLDDRWLFVASGEPFAQVAAADDLARPGDVVLSPPVAALLAPHGRLQTIDGDAARLLAMDPSPAAPVLSPPLALGLETLAPLVPEVVLARFTADQLGFLSEFRQVSVTFVRLSFAGLPPLDAVQGAVNAIQNVARRLRGEVYQCLHDDKGFVAILAFGMPPRSHEDDAARACLAAIETRDRLREKGIVAAIGVASGRLFCGAYGSSSRRQYSLVGSPMNLAARLMEAVDAHAPAGRILVDEHTADLAGDRIAFEKHESLGIRGREETVGVWRPRGTARASLRPSRRLIGRRRELALLTERITALAADGAAAGPVLVEADAGMGKSTLLAAMGERARELGLAVARGQAESLEDQTPFYAFRGIFRDALGIEAGAEASALERVRGLLGDDRELVVRLPLLRAVLPWELPDNELTRLMSGQVRADNTNRLLIHLLTQLTVERPLLVVLEDGHWLDTASWALAQRLARSTARMMLVASTRPLEQPPSAYAGLRDHPQALLLRLQSLPVDELSELVARRLAVDSVPTALAELIAERAGGNPFFAEELALSLRDSGAVEIDGEECRLVSEHRAADVLPETLQGLITSRVDALPAPAQLTLRVASVIGRTFEPAMLRDVHPGAAREDEIAEHLHLSAARDLLQLERDGDRATWAFRHAVVHLSVYELLPYAQRRALHRAAAEHLETVHREHRQLVFARLAHHYDRAEMPQQAMDTLRLAGGQAIDAYANREAVRLLQRALELHGSNENGLGSTARAEVYSHLARAHYALTDYRSLEQSTHAALQEIGARRPSGGWSFVAELGALAAHSLWETATGRGPAVLEGEERERWTQAIFALGELIPALMFQGRRVHTLQASLELFNLSRRIEGSPIASACRAGYGISLAHAGMRERGEAHLRRAVAECEAFGDITYMINSFHTLGLYLTHFGRPAEGLPWLQRSTDLAEELGTGIWRHRGKTYVGHAAEALGRFAEAAQAFREGSIIALDAEPRAHGLLVALEGINELRLGRMDLALTLLQRGVAGSREHPAALPLFVALGGLAETHLLAGRSDHALETARIVEAIGQKSHTEVGAFLTGVHAYSAVSKVYLHNLRRLLATADADDLPGARAECARAQRALRRFARLYVVARPRYELLEGEHQHLLGRSARAVRHWRRAAELAEGSQQAYELALARHRLARHGPHEERAENAAFARATLKRLGAAQELEPDLDAVG